MTTHKKIILVIMSLLLCGCISHNEIDKKDFIEKSQNLVLEENEIGQEYFFKEIKENEICEYRIIYIGDINTRKKGKIKFLKQTTHSGIYDDCLRANTKVYLYDANNFKIGYYYIGGDYYSAKTNNNKLLITQYSEDCNQTTELSFSDSIPQQIFIKSKEDNQKANGDVYTFTLED